MFKKSFMAVMALVMMFFVAGCGGSKEAPKAADDKPAVAADQSILGYAELYVKNDTSKVIAEGLMKPENAKLISDMVTELIQNQFKEYPLSEANVTKITEKYFEQLQKITKVATKLKKDDPEHPVVEVTATTVNGNVTEEELAKNEGIQEIAMAMQEAMAQGINADQMKDDENLQNRVMAASEKFIATLPTVEHSIDITCKMDKGDDGKNHWVPEEKDLEALAQFAQGQ